jgi:hypothetical protein
MGWKRGDWVTCGESLPYQIIDPRPDADGCVKVEGMFGLETRIPEGWLLPSPSPHGDADPGKES